MKIAYGRNQNLLREHAELRKGEHGLHLEWTNVDAAYPLDSLVKKMDVIPLETTDSCLFDDVALLEESEDYFFIYSEKTSQLYRFAKDGKNMKTISGKGQGPQEYLSIKRMMLDNESKELYIMDYLGRKMKIFSFDGEYLRSLPLPEDFAYTNCLGL